jgi:low affinity Fe/Cu permease
MTSSVRRLHGKAAAPPSRSFRDTFANFARAVAVATGSPWAFFGAVAVVIAWAAAGPWANYSDYWQLVINTGTTIATFLIVFLIQNTQNRESRVVQLKLDELIRAITPARTELVNMETMSEAELQALQAQFEQVQAEAARNLEKIAASRKPPSEPA